MILPPPAQAAEIPQVLIADLPGNQTLGQRVGIELGVGARARDRAHVDNVVGSDLLEQAGKFGHRTGGVTNGIERGCHGYHLVS